MPIPHRSSSSRQTSRRRPSALLEYKNNLYGGRLGEEGGEGETEGKREGIGARRLENRNEKRRRIEGIRDRRGEMDRDDEL